MSEQTLACAWCGLTFLPGSPGRGGRRTCRACGVATTDPWPSEDELQRAYGAWYRPRGGRFLGPGDVIVRRTRASLAKRIDAVAPPGPILDVGAGGGVLLDALRRTGREALGIERGSTTHPHIRSLELPEVEGKWAAIVFWHSLEHLRDPRRMLDVACDLLLPGGVLFIAVPNSNAVQAKVFGDRWFALDVPRHLVHLHSAALIADLEQRGLQIERTSYLRGGQAVFGWLHGFVGTLPGRPDLYDAIRRPSARHEESARWRSVIALGAATMLLPVASVAALFEAMLRRGATVYVEART